MSPTPNIPDPSSHGVFTYTLLSEGNPVDPGYEVMRIVITREVNRIPTARIVIRDGSASDESFEISNTDHFVPGKQITIKLGRDGDDETAFDGIVVQHGVRVNQNGQSNLVVICKNAAVKMTLGRHNRYFEDQSDSEIIEALISGYSLASEVDTTSSHVEVVQHYTTDWDFLLTRAEANGMLVISEDDKIVIKKPDTSQEPEISLQYGQNLLEFEADMEARTQWKKVVANGWDYSNQTLFEVETDSVSFAEPGNITGSELAQALAPESYDLRHGGHVMESELQAWSDGCMLRSRLSKIRGRAKVREGYLGFKPGAMVNLQGVGERFNGDAYITAVRHVMRPGAWDSHIQFGLDPETFASTKEVMDSAAAGLLPGVNGLHVGKVVQLQDDPAGEHRIKVKVPILDNNADGIWCRVASLDAGDNRGAFFRPEIDDEVVVGFINDDPRDAIVLGMLNSSAKPAPLEAKDDNHEKGFFTRSEMRIHFDDDKKIMTIDTPAGNRITLDEEMTSVKIEDQNSNVLEMGSNGITLESPSNIEIKAGANLTLSATATLSIGGASLSATADGPIELEGAIANLKASGITEITGSLVKIN